MVCRCWCGSLINKAIRLPSMNRVTFDNVLLFIDTVLLDDGKWGKVMEGHDWKLATLHGCEPFADIFLCGAMRGRGAPSVLLFWLLTWRQTYIFLLRKNVLFVCLSINFRCANHFEQCAHFMHQLATSWGKREVFNRKVNTLIVWWLRGRRRSSKY